MTALTRVDVRDCARIAVRDGGLSVLDWAALDVLLNLSDKKASPVEKYRSHIGGLLDRTARTVTTRTSRLEAAGWLVKQYRRMRTASGQFVSLATRYVFRIPEEWSRAVTREEPRTTPRPPPAADPFPPGPPLVAVPPVRTERPDRAPSPLQLRVEARAAHARAP